MKKNDTDSERVRAVIAYAMANVGRWVRGFGVPEHDREDVTQDVLVAVLRCAHTYNPALPLRPWLGTIAYRMAKDHRRRACHRYEVPSSPFCEDAEAQEASPEERVMAAETHRLVRVALQGIAPERRSVLVLHARDGAVMAGVAAELGVRISTAYTRLRLARATFKILWRRLECRGSPLRPAAPPGRRAPE